MLCLIRILLEINLWHFKCIRRKQIANIKLKTVLKCVCKVIDFFKIRFKIKYRKQMQISIVYYVLYTCVCIVYCVLYIKYYIFFFFFNFYILNCILCVLYYILYIYCILCIKCRLKIYLFFQFYDLWNDSRATHFRARLVLYNRRATNLIFIVLYCSI